MLDPLKTHQPGMTPEEFKKYKEREDKALEVKIKEAALIIEAMETEGGELLVKKICEMSDVLDKPVEEFMTTDLTQQMNVDSVRLAHCAGGRSVIQAIIRFLEVQKDIVEREAMKQTEREKAQGK